MKDFIDWMIPWLGGFFFNDLFRWWKARQTTHKYRWKCPHPTCTFKVNSSEQALVHVAHANHLRMFHKENV